MGLAIGRQLNGTLQKASLNVHRSSDRKSPCHYLIVSTLNLSNANLNNWDFSGMDLSGVDFSNANLTKANLQNVPFKWATMRLATLDGVNATSGYFRLANIARGSFINTNFRNSNFTDAYLD